MFTETIDEDDYDFEESCNEVADSLEDGYWHGTTSSLRGWGLSVNGKDGEQFNPQFADIVSN